MLPPLLRHHEFVAIRVGAHREVERVFGRIDWLASEDAAAGFQAFDPGAEVVELKGESGPRSLPLPSPVDPNRGSGDHNLAPDLGFHEDFSRKQVAIKMDATLPVGGPEGVFDFCDLLGADDSSPTRRFNAKNPTAQKREGSEKNGCGKVGDAAIFPTSACERRLLPCGVMVTQCPLEALFMVRVHAGQPLG